MKKEFVDLLMDNLMPTTDEIKSVETQSEVRPVSKTVEKKREPAPTVTDKVIVKPDDDFAEALAMHIGKLRGEGKSEEYIRSFVNAWRRVGKGRKH